MPHGARRPPTIFGRILGDHLRSLRERVGDTPEVAAKAIGKSRPTMTRIEAGYPGIREHHVITLLDHWGVSDEQERSIPVQMVQEINRGGWWEEHRSLGASHLLDMASLEWCATKINLYGSFCIPVLLQIPEYSESISSQYRSHLPAPFPFSVENVMDFTMLRKGILQRSNAPKVMTIIYEAAIHRSPAGNPLLKCQLQHLYGMSAWSNVTIRILPFRCSPVLAPDHFWLYEMRRPWSQVVTTTDHSAMKSVFSYGPGTTWYCQMFNEMLELSLDPEESTQLLLHRIKELS